MKKRWKWVVDIAFVLCIASVAFLINVKSTAEEIYSPINDENTYT